MKDDSQHRRHAIQVVAALPEDSRDALLVLDLARQLVEGFLSARPEPTQKPALIAVPIGGNECA
jgi:hypothetical protein